MQNYDLILLQWFLKIETNEVNCNLYMHDSIIELKSNKDTFYNAISLNPLLHEFIFFVVFWDIA